MEGGSITTDLAHVVNSPAEGVEDSIRRAGIHGESTAAIRSPFVPVILPQGLW